MIPIFFDMYINLDGVSEHLEHLRIRLHCG